jgi:transketolase
LFNKFMTFNPKNPDWVNRDRFVLSYVFPSDFRDFFASRSSAIEWWPIAERGLWQASSISGVAELVELDFPMFARRQSYAFLSGGFSCISALLRRLISTR